MKKVEKILMVLILMCLCALAGTSIFVWHNAVTTIAFVACIIIWLLVLDLDLENGNHEKE